MVVMLPVEALVINKVVAVAVARTFQAVMLHIHLEKQEMAVTEQDIQFQDPLFTMAVVEAVETVDHQAALLEVVAKEAVEMESVVELELQEQMVLVAVEVPIEIMVLLVVLVLSSFHILLN
tara:strand:+ start:238 stop:600 length:363 start_codon:yes stop_codon:yes gene_type:complete